MATKEERKPKKEGPTRITLLLDHYNKGKQDVDIRRTRHNGWNQTVDAYMSQLRESWPYQARVTDPRLRTTIVEKTGRLINSKLQGRLVPRKGSTIIGARLNNSILDFQWDAANFGGSMLEKVAMADQVTRLYGSAYALTFWDASKNSNDIKILNPNDIFIDFAANHIRNARWAIVREFTTVKQLEARGFNVKGLDFQQTPSDQRQNEYQDKVKLNKSLQDRTGQDLSNPTLIVATEYTPTTETVFLPKQAKILSERKNPSKHGLIPISQLRYYPLGDDVYGESEAEPVLSLQRGINAFLSGFVDEMNLAMRPPLKVLNNQYRKETIEFGPGAQWVVDSLNAVEEVNLGTNAINSFNTVYPALVAAFNTAMGDQSLGVSNISGRGEDKTATEVRSLQRQQISRDQYNQQYLGEFLKDIMMMWLSNNQQFLFDDPTQEAFVMKIVGKENIRDFQALKLDEVTIADEEFQEVAGLVRDNVQSVTDEQLDAVTKGISIPTFPAEDGSSDPKMKVEDNGEEAEITVHKIDLDGLFDYIPDVKSMALGADQELKDGREKAFEIATNPVVDQKLQLEGEKLSMKDLLVTMFEDNGIKDAERLFEPIEQAAQTLPGAPGGVEAGAGALGAPEVQGLPGVPPAVPAIPGAGQLPPTQGL